MQKFGPLLESGDQPVNCLLHREQRPANASGDARRWGSVAVDGPSPTEQPARISMCLALHYHWFGHNGVKISAPIVRWSGNAQAHKGRDGRETGHGRLITAPSVEAILNDAENDMGRENTPAEIEPQNTTSAESDVGTIESGSRSPHHSREVKGGRSGPKQAKPNQDAAKGGRVKTYCEEVRKQGGNREISDWIHFHLRVS